MDELYNVTCCSCGQVWTPHLRSPLWWQAKKHAEKGFLDALHVSALKHGCKEEEVCPDVPYRVVGYDDTCRDFDIPYNSFVPAARKYLQLERDGGYVVFFVDNTRRSNEGPSRAQEHMRELASI